MFERLQQVRVTKAAAVAVVLALAVMPWFQGGRDPLGWMVLWGATLLGGFLLWRSDLELRAGRLGLIWLAFIAWTALSLIWTVNRYQTFTTLMLEVLIGASFVLAQSLTKDLSARRVFSYAYLLIATIASGVGLFLFVTQIYERATSTFYLPNPFAAFLLPAVIIALWQFAEAGQLGDGLIAMFNLGVFILADSRAATLVLLFVIFVGLWLSKHLAQHWRRLLIILVGALSVALLGNVARNAVTHRFNPPGLRFAQLTTSESGRDRIYYLKSALAIWGDHPVIGSGAGTYSTLHPKYQYRVISASATAHNYFLQILAELGLIGFGLILWLVVELLLGLIRRLKQQPELIPLALALLALLLHFAVDLDYSYPVLLTLGAILAALVYLPADSKRAYASLTKVFPLASSLILAVLVIWLFQNQINAQSGQNLQDGADYSRAITYYSRAIEHPPFDPAWLSARGINELTLASLGINRPGNLRLATADAQAAIKLDPDSGQHYLLLARVLELENQSDQAIAQLKQAIALDPYDSPDYFNDLASIYLGQNHLAGAKATATLLIQEYPPAVILNRSFQPGLTTSIAQAYTIRALAEYKLNDLTSARGDLETAMATDRTYTPAAQLLKQIGQ